MDKRTSHGNQRDDAEDASLTMLRDYMPAAAKPEDPLRTTTIMTYELGSIIRALIYAKHEHSQGNVVSVNAYLTTARIGLADLITQARLLAEQMGWKWFELENDGEERFRERMKEIEGGKL